MAKGNRATKKQAQPIPEIPDLGKLHKPRKGNRRAAKLIASGIRLWDQRHIERKARRQAIARQENQALRLEDERIVGSFVKELLAAAPGWKAGSSKNQVVPKEDSPVPVEELIAAAKGLRLRSAGNRSLVFYVAGLTYREHIRLRANLPVGITSMSSYHERTATRENARDLHLFNFDPREQQNS